MKTYSLVGANYNVITSSDDRKDLEVMAEKIAPNFLEKWRWINEGGQKTMIYDLKTNKIMLLIVKNG